MQRVPQQIPSSAPKSSTQSPLGGTHLFSPHHNVSPKEPTAVQNELSCDMPLRAELLPYLGKSPAQNKNLFAVISGVGKCSSSRGGGGASIAKYWSRRTNGIPASRQKEETPSLALLARQIQNRMYPLRPIVTLSTLPSSNEFQSRTQFTVLFH